MFSNNSFIYIHIKRFFDLMVSIFLIIFLVPVFAIIAFFILTDDGFPILFKQKRIGVKGKLFVMYKFRSMIVDSKPQENIYYCYEGDYRITKIGSFLRKYSLDELPQLINILLGQMSFVGPRPPVFDELDYEDIDSDLKKYIKLRTNLKPGITGYSQVVSRNDLDWNDKLRLDSYYLSLNNKNRLIMDLKIVLLTFKEILFSKGIYDKR